MHMEAGDTGVFVMDANDEKATANDLRERFTDAMGRVGAIMDEARAKGMAINFPGIQIDQYGRSFIPKVDIVKVL